MLIKWTCPSGHETEIEDDGGAASGIAIRQTRKRFEPGGCDQYIPGYRGEPTRCGKPIAEASHG